MYISHNSSHQYLLCARYQRQQVPVLCRVGAALRWGDNRNVEARGCIVESGEANRDPEEGMGPRPGWRRRGQTLERLRDWT